MNFVQDPLGTSFFVLSLLVFIAMAIFGLVFAGYFFLQWFRYRKREEYSLGSVVLQVAVPRDNELKNAGLRFARLNRLSSFRTGSLATAGIPS